MFKEEAAVEAALKLNMTEVRPQQPVNIMLPRLQTACSTSVGARAASARLTLLA